MVSAIVAAPIACWEAAENKVTLFQEPEKGSWTYSINGGIHQRLRGVLYHPSYAAHLVKIFSAVILENLKRNNPIGTHTFFPVLHTDGAILENKKYVSIEGINVALFARTGLVAEKISKVIWAVFNQSNGSVQIFDIDIVSPVFDSVRVYLGGIAGRFGDDIYNKRFRAIVDISLDEIKSINIGYASVLDRQIVIDEEQWAVTAVSSAGGKVGHSMIAYEGVDRDREGKQRQFLKYGHLTTSDYDREINPAAPRLQSNQARVEVFDGFFQRNKNWLYGPTWPQKREQIEPVLNENKRKTEKYEHIYFAQVGSTGTFLSSMLFDAAIPIFFSWASLYQIRILSWASSPQLQKAYYAFNFLRRPSFGRLALYIRRGDLPSLALAIISLMRSAEETSKFTKNCLDYSIDNLRQMGVIRVIRAFDAPKTFIEYVQNHPENYPVD